MKIKLLVGLMLAAILSACQGPFYINLQGYRVLRNELEPSWRYVAAHRYIETPRGPDGFILLSPREFDALGGGRCGDFSAALIYQLGPEAELVAIDLDRALTGTSTGVYHGIVRYRGLLIEPQAYGFYYPGSILAWQVDVIGYERAMEAYTWFGTKEISSKETPSIGATRELIASLR